MQTRHYALGTKHRKKMTRGRGDTAKKTFQFSNPKYEIVKVLSAYCLVHSFIGALRP